MTYDTARYAPMLREGRIAYGITTGFGVFKDRIISPDQVEQLQRNILVSHAVGVGEPFDEPTTRAIMVIRANTLARGHSGIRLETLQLLLAMLNASVHPVIPQKGLLGASGDPAPLAQVSLPLIGEGAARPWRRFTWCRGDAPGGAAANYPSGRRRIGVDQRHSGDVCHWCVGDRPC